MKKIKCNLTHREAIEEIIFLISETAVNDVSIGINENGETDWTTDAHQDHFNVVSIPVVFWHSDRNSDMDLTADEEMSRREKMDFYVEEFMKKEPEGFENIEFAEAV